MPLFLESRQAGSFFIASKERRDDDGGVCWSPCGMCSGWLGVLLPEIRKRKTKKRRAETSFENDESQKEMETKRKMTNLISHKFIAFIIYYTNLHYFTSKIKPLISPPPSPQSSFPNESLYSSPAPTQHLPRTLPSH